MYNSCKRRLPHGKQRIVVVGGHGSSMPWQKRDRVELKCLREVAD